jgi:hypothetical protein
MSTPGSDERFWEAARHVVDTPGAVPPDEILIAYREGRLAAEQRHEIERLLEGSVASRQRLTQLGGIAFDTPSQRVREEVLGTSQVNTLRRSSRWAYWVIAAAVLLAATLLTVRFGPWAPTDGKPVVLAALQPGLTFDIQVSALADRRSEATTTVALPNSTVRVVMQQQGDALPGIEFGLYRLANGGLERLTEADGLVEQFSRGAVDWRVTASRLVDTTPGSHPFYLAVGPRGSLPSTLATDARAPLEKQLAVACRGLAYESTLEIQAPLEPEKE